MQSKKLIAMSVLLSATLLIVNAGQKEAKVSAESKQFNMEYSLLNEKPPEKDDFIYLLDQQVLAKHEERVEREREEERLKEIRRKEEQQRQQQELSRNAINRGELFVITAYDLSYQSCGKRLGNPARGVTASGRNLSGETLESARAIAVDPRRIPLGTKVYIKFKNERYSHLDGYYTATDTGGAINDNRIDLFFGDNYSDEPSDEALRFGHQDAYILIE